MMGRDRKLVIALGLNLAIVVVQVVFGLSAHSLGLLSDAGHNLTDVAAVGLSLMAVRLVRRSPTEKQSFGYHRSGVLVAQANAAAILVATGLISFEAIRRLLHPRPVDGLIVVVVAAVALLVNGASTLLLTGHGDDLNMRSAMLHMAGDAAASAGVVVAGVVIAVTDSHYWLDPLISLVIGAIIAYRAVRLLVQTTAVLMEATPAGVDIAGLTGALQSLPAVEEVHDVHVWSLSSELHALSAHIVVAGHPSLEEAQVVGTEVKKMLAERFDIGHATLELECETCLDDDEQPLNVSHRPLTDRSVHATHHH